MARNDIETTVATSRSKRLRASASAVVLGLLTLAACSKGATSGTAENQTQNTVAGAPDSPAGKCSSPDALATVKSIIIDEAKTKFADDQSKVVLSDPDFPSHIIIDTVLVQGVDSSVNKISCQASLKLDVPKQYNDRFRNALSINNSMAANPGSLGSAAPDPIPVEVLQPTGYAITYTAQPEAGKSDLIYSLSDVDPVAHAVDLLATVMAAPAPPPQQSGSTGANSGNPASAATPPSAGGKHEYSAAYDTCMSSGDAAQGIDSAMLACSDDELQRQNAQLNADYRRVMSQANDVQQHMLRDSERTWIRYRDKHCQEGNDTGGTMDAINISDCVLSETKKRVDYLEQPIGMILH